MWGLWVRRRGAGERQKLERKWGRDGKKKGRDVRLQDNFEGRATSRKMNEKKKDVKWGLDEGG